MNTILIRHNNIQLYQKLYLSAVPSYVTVFRHSGTLISKREKPLVSEINRNQCNLQPHFSLSTSSTREAPVSNKIKVDLTVFKNVDLSQLKSAPIPASLYGFGGILPFVFPPLYFIVGSYSPILATAQLMYGATILAFVGGVKWGNALAKDDISHEQIGISTVPSLVAWISLLVPESVGYLVVSSGLLGALYIDLVSSKYPPWFCALRLTLTSVATVSLIISFLFRVLH